ncbi:hypothetical protein ACH4FX_23620 [Streptomyces sp. NPDC018019]|uniref:hypothetical protein n=1 Tax=Streptomyces sp. NPDC018019 TaxID=3365030 RepID=UPI0037B070DE
MSEFTLPQLIASMALSVAQADRHLIEAQRALAQEPGLHPAMSLEDVHFQITYVPVDSSPAPAPELAHVAPSTLTARQVTALTADASGASAAALDRLRDWVDQARAAARDHAGHGPVRLPEAPRLPEQARQDLVQGAPPKAVAALEALMAEAAQWQHAAAQYNADTTAAGLPQLKVAVDSDIVHAAPEQARSTLSFHVRTARVEQVEIDGRPQLVPAAREGTQ